MGWLSDESERSGRSRCPLLRKSSTRSTNRGEPFVGPQKRCVPFLCRSSNPPRGRRRRGWPPPLCRSRSQAILGHGPGSRRKQAKIHPRPIWDGRLLSSVDARPERRYSASGPPSFPRWPVLGNARRGQRKSVASCSLRIPARWLLLGPPRPRGCRRSIVPKDGLSACPILVATR